MDGVTDDLPCLQAAVNLAAAATVTAGITYGAPVSIPCGAYAISGPVVLPRSALIAYPFGVVQVSGASQNCVRIFEMSGFAAGKGAFEWAAVNGRTLGEEISNLTIVEAVGAYGIHYQYSATNTPVTNANATNERMENFRLHDVEFEGKGVASIYLQGDCYDCKLANIKFNGTVIASPTAEHVVILTDTCWTSSQPNDEACGFTFGSITGIQAGGAAGGLSALFQGRLNQTSMSNAFCNGVYGGLSNSQRYAFLNSFGATISNIANEGGAGLQILLSNTTSMSFTNWGVGTPTGANVLDGMDLIASSRNIFTHTFASASAGSSWQLIAPGGTFFRIKLDAASHQNQFYDTAQTGTVDITVSDTATNWVVTCNAAVSACATYFTIGTHP